MCDCVISSMFVVAVRNAYALRKWRFAVFEATVKASFFSPHFYQSFITRGTGCWWLKRCYWRAAFEYGYIIHRHWRSMHATDEMLFCAQHGTGPYTQTKSELISYNRTVHYPYIHHPHSSCIWMPFHHHVCRALNQRCVCVYILNSL